MDELATLRSMNKQIKAGYKAFNGYEFTQSDALAYNNEQKRIDSIANPSSFDLDCKSRLFQTIIGTL